MSFLCPCGSENNYEDCCQSFIEAQAKPQTPEQLMRSRYTAYSKAQIDYIKNTMLGKPLIRFNEDEAKKWAESITWLNLQVIETSMENVDKGFVEFIASFLDKNNLKCIHERSEFHKQNDCWFYVDGVDKEVKPKIKLGRNSPCPCRSGKKFKNCHEQ